MAQDSPFRQWEGQYRDAQELMEQLAEEKARQSEIGPDGKTFRSQSIRKKTLERDGLELIDFAIETASPFHKSIVAEQSVYYGGGYKANEMIGSLHMHTRESLNKKVFETVRAAQTHLDLGNPSTFYEADDDADGQWVDEIQDWLEMYEAADDEGEKNDTDTLHRLVGGASASKVGWNVGEDRLSDYSYSPLNFSPDPLATMVDLSDAGYVVETTTQLWYTLKTKLGRKFTARFKKPETRFKSYEVHEMWMRSHVCHELGLKGDFMVRATYVDRQLVDVAPSPFWFPGFPHVCGRGFKVFDATGMACRFWGFGYGSFLATQQKMLDETLAQVLLILQNQGLGQFLVLKGAVDWKKARREPGLRLEVDPEMLGGNQSIRDIITQIPPSDVPASVFQLLSYIEGAMTGNTNIDSNVLAGSAPRGSSGRAIGLVQSAAAAQISDHERAAVGVKKRKARRKLSCIQQFARRPVKPNQWRHTSDLRDFPKQARHIGLKTRIQDNSGLPHTPGGKIQMLLPLLEGGIIGPETFFDITELDRIYGIDRDTNQQQLVAQLQAGQQGGGIK